MNKIKNYINKNILCIAISAALFTTGIIIGSVIAVNVGPATANELRTLLSPMVSDGALSLVGFGCIVSHGCISHLRVMMVMALCCVSRWLVPLGAFVIGAKGYQLGFSVCFLCGNFGIKGIAVSLLSAFMSYFAAIPIYTVVLCSVIRYAFARTGGSYRRTVPLWYIFFACYIALCVASCIEGLILPVFVDMLY